MSLNVQHILRLRAEVRSSTVSQRRKDALLLFAKKRGIDLLDPVGPEELPKILTFVQVGLTPEAYLRSKRETLNGYLTKHNKKTLCEPEDEGWETEGEGEGVEDDGDNGEEDVGPGGLRVELGRRIMDLKCLMLAEEKEAAKEAEYERSLDE